MSTQPANVLPEPVLTEPEELRRSWGLLLTFGLCLVIIGTIALSCARLAIFTTVIWWGIALIASGLVYAIDAFLLRRWRGCVEGLLLAVVDVVVGYLMLTYTWQIATGITMLMAIILAIYFVVSGVTRIVISLMVYYPGRILSILGGIISILLGCAIWMRWPADAYWLVGLVIGVELIIRGVSLIALALAARRIPAPGSAPAA
jgi:uncharacterized membrane protein HdeD (DUF308 family)